MTKQQLHPERVLKVLLVALLATVWGLGLAGFFTANRSFYHWAAAVAIVTFAIACLPLIACLIASALEKLRRRRRD